MTKRQIAELVNERLAFDYHPSVVAMYFDLLIRKSFHSTDPRDPLAFLRSKWNNFDLFRMKRTVSINLDDDSQMYYCDIPVSVIMLEDVYDSVRIQGARTKNILFVPVGSTESLIQQDLEVSKMGSRIRYRVENGQKVIFLNKHISEMQTVILDLLASFNAYEWDDEIQLPNGKEFDFINVLIQTIQNRPVDDITTDINEKTK